MCILPMLFASLRTCLHQASASTLRWRLQFCSHWEQWSCSRMGLQPIFKQLHCFQWEQNRKCHHSVGADAWCKQALRDYWSVWTNPNNTLNFYIECFEYLSESVAFSIFWSLSFIFLKSFWLSFDVSGPLKPVHTFVSAFASLSTFNIV